MKENKKKPQAYALRERTIELVEWAAECADVSRSVIVQDALDLYFDMIKENIYAKKEHSAAESSRTE